MVTIPGHANAAVVRANKLKYFEPNEGQAIFNVAGHPQKSSSNTIAHHG